ncbi:MAG: hypothetical protein Q8L85_08090, partial [Alphaproteobacteria bacterium]|nr:hypothetical protein [Alphaproteobacteria bacterium]
EKYSKIIQKHYLFIFFAVNILAGKAATQLGGGNEPLLKKLHNIVDPENNSTKAINVDFRTRLPHPLRGFATTGSFIFPFNSIGCALIRPFF